MKNSSVVSAEGALRKWRIRRIIKRYEAIISDFSEENYGLEKDKLIIQKNILLIAFIYESRTDLDQIDIDEKDFIIRHIAQQAEASLTLGKLTEAG